jgi:hypothetical protein
MKIFGQNCFEFSTLLSTRLSNFDTEKLARDFPPPPKIGRNAFAEGKATFSNLFPTKGKSNYHVHFDISVVKSKKDTILIELCYGENSPSTVKHETKRATKKKVIYWEDFFPWLKRYIKDFSMVECSSQIGYEFSNKKYQLIFTLPFKLEIPSVDKIDLGDIKANGLSLDLRNSKIGVTNIFIDATSKSFSFSFSRVAIGFTENYFKETIKITYDLAKVFLKE